jgi:hypothetical protein
MSFFASISTFLSTIGSLASIKSFFSQKYSDKEQSLRNIREDLDRYKNNSNLSILNKESLVELLKIIDILNNIDLNYKKEPYLINIFDEIVENLNEVLLIIFSLNNFEKHFNNITKSPFKYNFNYNLLIKKMKLFKCHEFIFKSPIFKKFSNEKTLNMYFIKNEFYTNFFTENNFLDSVYKLHNKKGILGIEEPYLISNIEVITFFIIQNKIKIQQE